MKTAHSLTLILTLLLALTACKPEQPDIKTRIKKAELGTVQYTVRQIIRNSDETWHILGDKKVLFSIKATVKAGIDLDQIADENIVVDRKRITLVLPHAQVQAINIQPRDIRQAYSKVSTLRSNYTQQEYDAILQAGEYAIKSDRSLQASITAEAEANAKEFFELLLRSSGFTDITILFQ